MDKSSSSSPLRSLLTPLNSLGKFEGFVFLIVMVCLVAGGVGAVFGFIGFSEGDRFAAKFSALVTADANLQTGLVNERTMRTAADMTLMNEQAALQVSNPNTQILFLFISSIRLPLIKRLPLARPKTLSCWPLLRQRWPQGRQHRQLFRPSWPVKWRPVWPMTRPSSIKWTTSRRFFKDWWRTISGPSSSS